MEASKQRKTREVIDRARFLLKSQIYDAGHDINHHERVWKLAEDITRNINDPVDMGILKISCFWHDVLIKEYSAPQKKHRLITYDTAQYLKDFMVKINFSKYDSQKAYLAVKHHELNDKPANIEGKVLFDADKLDAFNKRRSEWYAKTRQGRSWRVKVFLLKSGLFRMYVKKKFHYEYSRKIFEEKVKSLT